MKRFTILALLPILFSCGSGERVSKEVFEEVNNSMEVKKLSDAEILASALEWGDSISAKAQAELISNLQKAISEKGIPGAVEFCSTEAMSIKETIGSEYGVTIKRVSNAFRNPNDKPDEMEGRILETYEYDVENQIKPTPNIQAVDGGEVFLYSKAIVIPSGLCLNCHGEPQKEINSETLSKIDSIYPEDLARNHKVGDLRGMWAIYIPKSEIVKKL
ncbi:Tll0287-like domain-containing protein [Algoriphagus zhangzhouensis]|uniref:Tll0287-like domain-containing protein n=1 Tax=Algoriphagus zhangzhouensis TaxID=1073327 RepID=A0A1M7ZAM5_9BACT|nr:DUF3365 domain-containing protein [Algoriphagus zhangzhouensis]TDY47078.1 uncharacterized protein DUF3365 [Algoriphagus zhangzhouensis]SHO61963.1 Protein of unknown function [Algoriphagus zhangzhouensis]